ncbi:DUF805 domain-containing protein [Herbiconiux sp. P15]|uniref:DUF805 domain-containing protein n=1 Tax=Herbiconiux liukaitaii TaxID=3342799 RepID=UPI0035B7CD5D
MTTATAPVPLEAPYYGAPFGAAVARFWKKYATFTGRASRSEYWWWYLVSISIAIVFNILSSLGTGGYGLQPDADSALPRIALLAVWVIWGIWALATFVPGLALTARRLHDTDHSAWWILIVLVPLVGPIVLLVFLLSAPVPAGKRFD